MPIPLLVTTIITLPTHKNYTFPRLLICIEIKFIQLYLFSIHLFSCSLNIPSTEENICIHSCISSFAEGISCCSVLTADMSGASNSLKDKLPSKRTNFSLPILSETLWALCCNLFDCQGLLSPAWPVTCI